MIYLLIGYMWLFVHRPFEIWPWLGTYHIERLYMIFTLICWLISTLKIPAYNRLHVGFLLFIIVMFASWSQSPYQALGEPTMELYLKYAVFYFLVITSVRNEHDLRTILAGYLGVMSLLMIHSLREFYFGRTIWAQGFNRLLPVGVTYDFNDFAGLIVCSVPFVWVLWSQQTTRRNRLLLLGYLGLACYCVILTGSRMGALGLLLASIMACLASPKRWRLLPIYPVLFAVAWLILPDDHKERYLTLLGDGHNTKFTSAGDWRLDGFEKALPLFDERPLWGFGPMSYGKASGRGMMAHNLYGQLLAELGLAGTIAFGLMLWGVAQNLFEARHIARFMDPGDDLLAWHAVAAMSAVFLLLVIMGWGFNFLFWHVWLWFGSFQVVALGCLKQQVAHARQIDAYEMQYQPQILTTRYA